MNHPQHEKYGNNTQGYHNALVKKNLFLKNIRADDANLKIRILQL